MHERTGVEVVRQALEQRRYRDALREAEERLAHGGAPDPLRELHRLATQAAFFLGEREVARRHGFAALGLANQIGDPLTRARAHNDLAVLLGSDGVYQPALAHLWQAVHATEEAGAEVEGGPLNNLGNVYLELGRCEEAVAIFGRAADRFRGAGDEAGAAMALSNQGRAHTVAGRAEQGIAALQEARAAFQRLGRPDDLVATHAKLGTAFGAAGDAERARAAFEAALALHQCGHARRLQPETCEAYGVWALGHGDVDTALAQLRSADDAFEAEGRPRASVLEPLSRALEAAGRPDQALVALRRHVELEARRKEGLAYAATHVRMLELELGTEGEQEIARLRTVALERSNRALREEAARLSVLSATDGLTGLRNRRALERCLADEVRGARRSDGPLVLALLDLDRFKEVNDVLGHATGDAVLRRVAGLLLRNVRRADLAGRWGGEEFALVLPGMDLDDARRLLGRLGSAIAKASFDDLAPGLRVTASIGAAGLEEVTDVAELLRLADRRLYAAKAAGRARTVVIG